MPHSDRPKPAAVDPSTTPMGEVRLRLTESEGPAGEWLAAKPVLVNERGEGVYCLYNASFFTTLTVGDLVQTRTDGRGGQQIVGIHRRGGRLALFVIFPPTASFEERMRPLLEEWRATGTWSEGAGAGQFAISVPADPGARPTLDELEALRTAGTIVHYGVMSASGPDDIDFTLDMSHDDDCDSCGVLGCDGSCEDRYDW